MEWRSHRTEKSKKQTRINLRSDGELQMNNDPQDGIAHVYKALGQLPEKKPPEATEIWLGQWKIKPTSFSIVAEYDKGIECFKLKYAAFRGPDWNLDDTHVLKIHYSNGRDVIFRECYIIEAGAERSGDVYYRELVLKCTNKVNVPDPVTELPWEKIEDPKKPDLFVIQDWKMDLTKCQIDIKTNYDGGRSSIALIYFFIEVEENNDFGSIKGQPIFYFEYPEGKYTFQSIKTLILKTVTIEGKKFVPYQFEAKLIKEILT